MSLSNEYYQSAYCLNKEGIIWFYDVPVIIVAMPEIQPDSMLGFLGDEYKIRRLSNESDIAAIYDQIVDVFSISRKSVSSLTYEIKKLKERYDIFISKRVPLKTPVLPIETEIADITTDDESIIMYYLLSHKVRKIKDTDITQWLIENELYNVNVANAFDLLAAAGLGTLTTEDTSSVFELEISQFRALSNLTDDKINTLKESVNQHRHLSKNQFVTMWNAKLFDDSDLLFITYIHDESTFSFGNRWMADGQIADIKKWEEKHSLEGVLSKDYGKCLAKFIENNLVYESSWTSYGNPREYTLHKSIKSFFMNNFPYTDSLEIVKEKYILDLPF